MKKRDWDKAVIMLRNIGAGHVILENKRLKQRGNHLNVEIISDRGTRKFGIGAAAKTSMGSIVAGAAPSGFGIGIYPIWRTVASFLLVRPIVLKWFLKRLLRINKNRQRVRRL